MSEYRYWQDTGAEISEIMADDLPYPFFRLNSTYFRTSQHGDLITVTKPDHQELVIFGDNHLHAVSKLRFVLEIGRYLEN